LVVVMVPFIPLQVLLCIMVAVVVVQDLVLHPLNQVVWVVAAEAMSAQQPIQQAL
jgi:hypothetical protein